MKTSIANNKPAFPKAVILALAISSAGALPASADDCSNLINRVSVAMTTANLPSEDVIKIESARASAAEKQVAGDIDGCMADLVEAKAILNLE